MAPGHHKRRLKTDGYNGVQGEFGIGLLSFWTVGENLAMTCAGDDGKTYTMHMQKGDPGYSVQPRRLLFSQTGTELKIAPLLPGLKQLSGEKMQWYLASELRERIRQTGVEVQIVDRVARKQFNVEPRQFSGRLLHHIPPVTTDYGDLYIELYLSGSDTGNQVGLYRHGTRVLANIVELPQFEHAPWTEGLLEGILDAPFLNLTPATRTGLLHDERLAALQAAVAPLEQALNELIEEQRRAERTRASREMLRTLHKAFREALLALPAEEYDWLEVQNRAVAGPNGQPGAAGIADSAPAESPEERDESPENTPQKQFFEYAGALHNVRIAPASCVLPVGQTRTLRAVCRDKSRRTVEHDLTFEWEITDGGGSLDDASNEIVSYTAPAEPGLVKLKLCVAQGIVTREAEALVTVTDSLMPESREPADSRKGLPGYTFERAPGKLWRSRYDVEQNVVVINNGHRDFVYASKAKALKLRYIARLYAKELVLKNFPGLPAEQLMERLIELSLYTEENLK